MTVPYVDHAERHLPGGTDPLKFAAAYASCKMFTDVTVPAGGDGFLAWDEFRTNAPSVFATTDGSTFNNAAGGDNQLRLMAQGLYAIWVNAQWENATYVKTVYVSGGSLQKLITSSQHPDSGATAGTAVDGSGQYLHTSIPAVVNASQASGDISGPFVICGGHNGDSVDRKIINATLAVLWFPSEIDYGGTDIVYN